MRKSNRKSLTQRLSEYPKKLPLKVRVASDVPVKRRAYRKLRARFDEEM